MKNKFNKYIQTYKRHGVSGLLILIFRDVAYQRKSTTRLFLYTLSTPKPSAKSIAAAEGHEFRFATLEELESLKKDPKWEINDVHIEAHKNGDQCLLQLDNDKIAGYTWIRTNPLTEIMWGFHFNMPDDTVYNYKGYTPPEYRGKGFQPLRHLKVLEHIQKDGKKRLFSYVHHLNMNSQKGVSKSGYKKIGVLFCKRGKNGISFKLKVNEDAWSLQTRN